MANGVRGGGRHVGDGVTLVTTKRGRAIGLLLALVLAMLGVAAWLVVRAIGEDEPRRASVPTTGGAVDTARRVPSVASAAPPAAASRPTARHGEERHARHAKAKKEEPTFTLLKPGEHAGLGVFPPPGTKPIKQGIIVPDGFELPPGYVRHYQTTDDGRRLPPILMFHPDYEGVDAEGNAVPLPEDRIVPPDMAPRGMPIEMLGEPAEQPGAPGRAR